MAWSNPQTWTNLQLVNSTDLNRELRDNLLFLAGTTGIMPSPHMTSPVIDSGGLGITSGSLQLSAGNLIVSGNGSFGGALTLTGGISGSVSVAGGVTATGALSGTTFTASGVITANAGVTIPAGQHLQLGTSPATSQLINVPNLNGIGFRNGTNSGDLTITNTSSDALNLGGGWATAGVAGAATGSLTVIINGATRQINFT